MRTIKFRGKCLDNSEWVYGDLLRMHGVPYIYPDPAPDGWNDYEFIPDTVGQFTGLLDKNGKEMYEGDIYRFDHPDSINEVSYCIGGGFAGFDFSPAFTNGNKLTNIEVIGNIHDNPELLKQ